MRFIIVRHAETQWNKKKIIQGKFDSPVTYKGYRQIDALLSSIENLDITKIVCSPSGRTYTTAKLVAKKFNCDIQKDTRLQEQNFGNLEGVQFDLISRNYPDLAECILSGEPWYIDPNSESSKEVFKRVYSCLLSLVENNNPQTICVVTHGLVIQSLIWHLLGEQPTNDIKKYSHANCSYSIIEFENDSFKVINWGVATHLKYL